MPYYGLYIPVKGGGATSAANNVGIAAGGGGDQNSAVESAFVFRVKSEALDVLKLHKDARLREFISEDDAIKYAQTGYEEVQTNKYADVKTSTAGLEKAAFRGPTKQELVEFRKIIESGDYERVKTIIWDNPRYLVSSGDTPTTLKEGYRYNAMHVCAISKKPRIAELILQTVSDPKFVDLLTGKTNDQKMCKELCKNLLDYYLNIPEKGRSETPLHFAAKTGAIEMVEVLTSYPECKMTPNNEGLLPKEIICSRNSQASPELCRKIEKLLDERFYVPVLRSMDSAIPPQIGQPFSANNPPNLNCDPLSPEVKIQALAGPMNKEHAKQFCRRWKTPPRMGSNASSPIANNPYISPMKQRGANNATPTKTPQTTGGFGSPNSITLQRRTLFNSTPQRSPLNGSNAPDQNGINSIMPADECDASFVDKQNGNHKNIEYDAQPPPIVESENNNNLQHLNTQINMLKTALCPNTPLLKLKKDAFFTYREQQLSSPVVFEAPDGLNISTMSERDQVFDSPGYKERHIKITNTEKGLECIGRELAKEQKVEWREYWDFLNAFIDIASADGLRKLESYFAERLKDLEMSRKNSLAMAKSAVILDDVCSALEKFGFSNDAAQDGLNNRYGSSNSNATNSSMEHTTPYTCVEKSLQVFAKRMTKSIKHNIDNVVSINDTLLSELKRLKSLICSFKDDVRFLHVNFAKVHSRIGNLVSIYLENSQEVNATIKTKILIIIKNLIMTPGERREHIECVCSRILYKLENPTEQILPENLKTEDMCSKIWLQEKECDCQWETNLSRKTSRRNRMEARYKNHQDAKQQEKKANKQTKAQVANTIDEWRNASSGNDSSDELDDDVFWSDFGGSDTEDEEEVWLTPPESVSRISMLNAEDSDEDGYKIFVYGTEPTKRDLDVLNAIFHVDIDKIRYPHVFAWRTVLQRFPNEEMDYFPSPAVVKKTHSFKVRNSAKKETSQQSSQQLPAAKRLFMSPLLSKATVNSLAASSQQRPKTPLNKLRGLFSAYRDRLDNSPLSASSAHLTDDSEESNNMSLLQISASE